MIQESIVMEPDLEEGKSLSRGKSWPATASDTSAAETTARTSPNTSFSGHQSTNRNEPATNLEATYRCQICFERNPIDEAYRLPCEHPFCRDCLVNYLFSKITDGQVYPACFYIDENSTEAEPETTPDGNANVNKYHTCGKIIPTEVIETLLSGNEELYEKYKRFKFSKENKHARECPFCATWNVANAEALTQPGGGRIVCIHPACGKTFCYFHANAHDFAVHATCAEYDASVAPQQQSSVDFISATSKPCPGCQVMVQKSGSLRYVLLHCVSSAQPRSGRRFCAVYFSDYLAQIMLLYPFGDVIWIVRPFTQKRFFASCQNCYISFVLLILSYPFWSDLCW